VTTLPSIAPAHVAETAPVAPGPVPERRPAVLPAAPAPESIVSPAARAPAPESLARPAVPAPESPVRPAVPAPAPERFPVTTTGGAPSPLAAPPAVERQDLPAIVPTKRPAIVPAPSAEGGGGQNITIPGKAAGGQWSVQALGAMPQAVCGPSSIDGACRMG